MGIFVDMQKKLCINIASLLHFTEARGQKKICKVVFNELGEGTRRVFDK